LLRNFLFGKPQALIILANSGMFIGNKINRMFFNAILFLFAGISALSCFDKAAPDSNDSKDQIQIAIEKSAGILIEDPKINALSVGVYKDGKKYTFHQGELDPGKGNTPNDSTIYEIASVSKSFTGTLVAQAILDDKLALEDDIRIYLEGQYPNLEYDGQPILIEHLITHTACLPRFFPVEINELFNTIDDSLPSRIYDIEKDYSKEEFLTDLRSISIDTVPGTRYGYSNADVELMAHILERAYEFPFSELLEKLICEKAGLRNTKAHLSTKEADRLANGYGASNQPVPHFANTLWGAGGGFKSTTSDLLKYMAYQLDVNNLAAQKSHELLYEDEYTQIAYLWPVTNDAEDGTYYNIHGGAFGTQNFLVIVPKYKLGISIITNQSGPTTQEKLWNTVDKLLDEIKKSP